jgi:S-adenosylmethionine hydrolase
MPSLDACVEMAGQKIRGPLRSYSDGEAGEVVCLWGSHGFLEVAVNRGRAFDLLPGAAIGSEVVISYAKNDCSRSKGEYSTEV